MYENNQKSLTNSANSDIINTGGDGLNYYQVNTGGLRNEVKNLLNIMER